MLSDCCDITETKDVSTARYIVTVKKRFVICMMTGKDIVNGEVTDKRAAKDTKVPRSRVVDISMESTDDPKAVNDESQEKEGERGQEMLRNISLSTTVIFS